MVSCVECMHVYICNNNYIIKIIIYYIDIYITFNLRQTTVLQVGFRESDYSMTEGGQRDDQCLKVVLAKDKAIAQPLQLLVEPLTVSDFVKTGLPLPAGASLANLPNPALCKMCMWLRLACVNWEGAGSGREWHYGDRGGMQKHIIDKGLQGEMRKLRGVRDWGRGGGGRGIGREGGRVGGGGGRGEGEGGGGMVA